MCRTAITREEGASKGRYVYRPEDGGESAELTYSRVSPTRIIVDHTGVPDSLRGQGIGQALTEGIVYTEDGQPLTTSLMDYALPRAIHMPDLTLDTINTISPTNPLGAKGIGSVSTVPSPAAVANAVLNALSSTGVRHIDAPLTPERVWRGIGGGGVGGG